MAIPLTLGLSLALAAPSAAPSAAASPTPLASPIASPSAGPASPTTPATNKLTFHHELPNLGLPINPAGMQDSQGFMWFATQNGLLRYDGYEKVLYRTGPNSISNDNVVAVLEGPDGAIWVGSIGGGVDRYDRTTNAWTHYRHDPNNPDSLGSDSLSYCSQSLFFDRAGNLWVGLAGGGLDRLDVKSGKFTHFRHDANDPNSLQGNDVYSIVEDPAGRIWVGTGTGLDRLDPGKASFVHFQDDPKDTGTLSAGWVYHLVLDNRDANVLWVGTIGGGLNRFDMTTGRVTRYNHDASQPATASTDGVITIYQDEANRLWIGWYGHPQGTGLSIFDKRTGTFTDSSPDPFDSTSIAEPWVRAIVRDRAGAMWVTLEKSIDKIDPAQHPFTLYTHDPRDPASVSSNSALSYYQDRAGTMWFGTVDAGFDRFDAGSGKFTAYRHNDADPSSIDSDFVTRIFEDSSGDFWVAGGAGTLCLFDRTAGKCAKQYRNDPANPRSLPRVSSIRYIVEDKDDPNVLWMGAFYYGLIKFDKRTQEFTGYSQSTDAGGLNNISVMHIFQDGEGILWLSTQGGGLNRFDKKTAKFTHYVNDPNDPTSIGSNTIWEVQGYDDASLWLATLGGGLERFDKKTGKFERFTKDNGFPANGILTLRRDEASGDFWMGTDEGLVRFNPRTHETRVYDERDGLQGHVFLDAAAWAAQDGQMWFGGLLGIDSFYPSQIKDNPVKPAVVFTSITQEGKPLKGLATAPELAKEITLDWQTNTFEFTVAALNYTTPDKNQIQYKLEGVDTDWYDAGTSNTGRYAGIPDGTYTLLVRASNNDGLWSDQVAALKVTVVPPFWRTTAFYVLVATLLLALLGGLFLLRTRSAALQRRRLEALVLERTSELEQAKKAAEAASEAKSRFLSSMSHELRSPLNTMLGFTRLLLRDAGLAPSSHEDLRIVLRSGEHLHGLIDSVLDLAKVEANRAVPEERPFDLHHQLLEVEDMFALSAEEKDVRLTLEIDPDVPQFVLADDLKLRQILVNLMANAVKFTQSGSIALRVRRLADGQGNGRHGIGRRGDGHGNGQTVPAEASTCRVVFEVVDTGPGMTSDEINSVFGAFVQAEAGRRSRKGTGLGLALSRGFAVIMGGDLVLESQIDKGTTARLTLPMKIVDATEAESQEIPQRRVVGLVPGQPTYRILVVDDRWSSRQLLIRLLAPLGFDVREAADGQEAIDIAEEFQPHLICMDLRMPNVDGLEATRRIKAMPNGRSIAILALTASAFSDDRADVLAEGCDDFLRKPFREEEFFATLERHLGARFVREGPEPEKLAPIDLAAMRALKPESLKQLKTAVASLDSAAIARAIDEIRGQDPALAARLDELASTLRRGALYDLVARATEDAGATA